MFLKPKIIKQLKFIITTLLMITFTLSVISCKEAPPVEEPVEETEMEEQQTTTETSLAAEEEQEKEEIPPKTEETQKEFNESMIKNRFVAPKGIPPVENSRIVGGEPVPLWYCREFGEGEIMVSGIVAGPVRKGIGDTGEEETLLPVAFQNPETKEFYIRDISFGNDAFFSQLEGYGGFAAIFFKDYTFTVVTGGGGYKETIERFETIESNFKIGDQVAFNILLALPPGSEGTEQTEAYKVYKNFMDVYIPNSISVYEAMKENKELPEVRLFAWTTMVNKV